MPGRGVGSSPAALQSTRHPRYPASGRRPGGWPRAGLAVPPRRGGSPLCPFPLRSQGHLCPLRRPGIRRRWGLCPSAFRPRAGPSARAGSARSCPPSGRGRAGAARTSFSVRGRGIPAPIIRQKDARITYRAQERRRLQPLAPAPAPPVHALPQLRTIAGMAWSGLAPALTFASFGPADKASERTKPRCSGDIARLFGASARAWASSLRCCGQSERTNSGYQIMLCSFAMLLFLHRRTSARHGRNRLAVGLLGKPAVSRVCLAKDRQSPSGYRRSVYVQSIQVGTGELRRDGSRTEHRPKFLQEWAYCAGLKDN